MPAKARRNFLPSRAARWAVTTTSQRRNRNCRGRGAFPQEHADSRGRDCTFLPYERRAFVEQLDGSHSDKTAGLQVDAR
jgi:hypothetical protein